ncbi:MAG: hypothetical protein O3B04_07070 [Chloroflexi bacterium]|nr:hypothetical protein [Chloroflexota bacterium]
MLEIQNEALFKQGVNSGINLLLGAGFSVLAEDSDGIKLPVGNGLRKELTRLSNKNISNQYTLSETYTVLKILLREKLDEYIRKRFTVKQFDERYRIVESCAVKSIITTNIDDLCYLVFKDSRTK